jgi:dTDP-4-amino-4,6-dideoxy-D-glucose transaminase
LKQLEESRSLTNNGVLVQQLEEELSAFLNVKYVSVVANGTLALMLALKTLDLEVDSNILTTPFSFIATTSSILWTNLAAKYIDLPKNNFNLDPCQVKNYIQKNPSVKAVVPVHCYGYACDVEGYQEITEDLGIPILYDAAHAFGADCHCGKLFQYGYASVLSFHATKVFHTLEGGAVVSSSSQVKKRVDLMRNFGFEDEVTISSLGVNAKMSELHAAVGLINLGKFKEQNQRRKLISEVYRLRLSNLKELDIPVPSHNSEFNYSYFPIFVPGETAKGIRKRDKLYSHLKSKGILTRRYFYPSIPNFDLFSGVEIKSGLINAANIAGQVLCLPIHADMTASDAEYIARHIVNFFVAP